MKSINWHLRILILILAGTGLLVTYYERYVLDIPFTESERQSLWTIDAKISFYVPGNLPVTAKFFLPSELNTYTKHSEALIANKEYGKNFEIDKLGNKIAHYSTRRARGEETLYYRLSLNPFNLEDEVKPIPGKTYREPIPLSELDKLAADGSIDLIRSRSSNTATFISETIKEVNDTKSERIKVLLKGDDSIANKARLIEILLSQAHIPVQKVNTLQLLNTVEQTPEIWVRSYIESSKQEDKEGKNGVSNWYYFNPVTAAIGLPQDRIIWYVGNDPILQIENALKGVVSFSVDDRELTAISLAQAADKEGSSYLSNSLYSLPIPVQQTYQIIMMIPFGVLVVLVMRNIVGIQTLGTFTPVLIALAFRETELGFGILLFTIIVALGLSLRSYLEHLKLQMLSRLSVVLTFVVILVAIISIFSYKLGFYKGLSISLFPMVILTMTIERLSVTWEERGALNAMKIAMGTLISSAIAYLLMSIRELTYLVFTFPGILLIMVAFMLLMGRYRGYRLTELKRFYAMLKEEEGKQDA